MWVCAAQHNTGKYKCCNFLGARAAALLDVLGCHMLRRAQLWQRLGAANSHAQSLRQAERA